MITRQTSIRECVVCLCWNMQINCVPVCSGCFCQSFGSTLLLGHYCALVTSCPYSLLCAFLEEGPFPRQRLPEHMLWLFSLQPHLHPRHPALAGGLPSLETFFKAKETYLEYVRQMASFVFHSNAIFWPFLLKLKSVVNKPFFKGLLQLHVFDSVLNLAYWR